MACDNITLKGILLDCSSSLGGIKKVWMTQYSDVESVTMDDTSQMIKTITLKSSKTWSPFEFRRGTSSMTSTLNVDESTGTNYVSTELNLIFTKMDTAKRIEVAGMAIGQLACVVLDSNGHYWYLGKDDYVSSSAGTGQTGTAKGDQNAYNITLSTESESYPYEIDPTFAAETFN